MVPAVLADPADPACPAAQEDPAGREDLGDRAGQVGLADLAGREDRDREAPDHRVSREGLGHRLRPAAERAGREARAVCPAPRPWTPTRSP